MADATSTVEVGPSELRFKFQAGRQLMATVTIKNGSDDRVGFKIKTTAPKRYVVRPSSGIAEAKSTVIVQVIMQVSAWMR
jgi:hypothetical protein